MYNILLKSHSGFRWLVIATLLITIIKSLASMKKGYGKSDNILRIVTLVFNHVQLLVGIALYILSPYVLAFYRTFNIGWNLLTFFALFHAIFMIASLVLVTMGSIKAKKLETPEAKHKAILWSYIPALILILASIPWFRGMG